MIWFNIFWIRRLLGELCSFHYILRLTIYLRKGARGISLGRCATHLFAGSKAPLKGSILGSSSGTSQIRKR
jgi:hypothetical protein